MQTKDLLTSFRTFVRQVELYLDHHEAYKKWAAMEMWDRDQVLAFIREKYGQTNRLMPEETLDELRNELVRRHEDLELEPVAIYQHPPSPMTSKE